MKWSVTGLLSSSGKSASPMVRVASSPIHGRGVFARRGFGKDEVIDRFLGKETQRDGRYVLWLHGEDDEWFGIRGTNELRFLNHAGVPNAGFDEELCLRALRPIEPGEEITIHYGESWEDVP